MMLLLVKIQFLRDSEKDAVQKAKALDLFYGKLSEKVQKEAVQARIWTFAKANRRKKSKRKPLKRESGPLRRRTAGKSPNGSRSSQKSGLVLR